MDSNNEENYEYNTKYGSIDNKIDSNNIKIISTTKNDKQINRREDDDNKLTTIPTNTTLNPFTAVLDMWQSYGKVWTDTYKQLFFRNPSMPSGEFWLMYYKFDSKTEEK